MSDTSRLEAMETAFRQSRYFARLMSDLHDVRTHTRPVVAAPSATDTLATLVPIPFGRESDNKVAPNAAGYVPLSINDPDVNDGAPVPASGAIAATAAAAGDDTDHEDHARTLPVGYRDRYATSVWTQLSVLAGRSFTDMYRDPLLLRTHMLVGVVSGGTHACHFFVFLRPCVMLGGRLIVRMGRAVLLGLFFFNLELNFAGIQNRFGLLLFILLVVAFASMSSIGVRTTPSFTRARRHDEYWLW
jgi:hypothetical protein